jgi:hypothetical protein
MIVSNENVQIGNTEIGVIRGSVGTITLQAGTMSMGKTILGADDEPGPPGPTSSGSLIVQRGQLSISDLHIGTVATGMVTVAGGFLTVPTATVSETNTSTGILTFYHLQPAGRQRLCHRSGRRAQWRAHCHQQHAQRHDTDRSKFSAARLRHVSARQPDPDQ